MRAVHNTEGGIHEVAVLSRLEAARLVVVEKRERECGHNARTDRQV